MLFVDAQQKPAKAPMAWQLVEHRSAPFQEQLQYMLDTSDTFKHLRFPMLSLSVSVQAGVHTRCSFQVAGRLRSYPFFRECDDSWDPEDALWKYRGCDDDSRRARHVVLRRLFPAASATSFEVNRVAHCYSPVTVPPDVHPSCSSAQVALLEHGEYLIALHTPTTLDLRIDPEVDWRDGCYVPAAVVQSILDQLQQREDRLLREERLLRERAALRIQRHFRGWRCRRLWAFNPHTDIGSLLLRLSFLELPSCK